MCLCYRRIPPSTARTAPLIELPAAEHSTGTVVGDGLHPNAAGYARMRQALQRCATVASLIGV